MCKMQTTVAFSFHIALFRSKGRDALLLKGNARWKSQKVCSAVQLAGFLLCLLGAAKITHRAQGTVSVATRWHAFATCTSYGASYPQTENLPSSPPAHEESSLNPFTCIDSASDSESSEVFFMFPSKDASAAFEIRQAFVTYLQHNNGGITIFGFVLDRGFLYTLFAFEFSLVMWILSEVTVFS